MDIFYDLRSAAYGRPGHPERPDRILRTVPFLKERHADWRWREPRAANDQELLRAHSPEYLAHVANPENDFDLDTPAYPNVDFYARQSAGAAIEAARAALGGERAFSLMRPPGHHAMRERAMGSVISAMLRSRRSTRWLQVGHNQQELNARRSGISTRTMATEPKHCWPIMKKSGLRRFISILAGQEPERDRLPMF